MPALLQQRLRVETIAEFQAAAQSRLREADALWAVQHRTAAIYLMGYAAEMLVKAAYFRLIGFSPRTQITHIDLGKLKYDAKALGIALGNLHDVEALIRTLIEKRKSISSLVPFAIQQEAKLREIGNNLRQIWRETLRYHSNVAYEFEVVRVRDHVAWLMTEEPNL